MQNLDIESELLQRHPSTERANQARMCYSAELEAMLGQRYGRAGLGLKIFSPWPGINPGPWDWWMGVPLQEATQIQNLFAFYGIAPRVWDLVMVNNAKPAQVVEFLPSQAGPSTHDLGLFHALVERYAIDTAEEHHSWDIGPRNWRNNKLVDFGGFFFRDKPGVIADLRRRAHTRRDVYIGAAYQEVPELEIRGSRRLAERLPILQLDALDWAGADVLDIGCNLGAICRYVARAGARRVVGLDVPDIAGQAHEVTTLLGEWGIEYAGLNLPHDARLVPFKGERYDVVFAMAVFNHMDGLKDWMLDMVRPGGTFFLEGHGGDPVARYEAQLREYFSTVDYLGDTTDNYVRPVFRCRKGA